ncbi:MAG: 4Fe-4S dicluster domain-containing protein, partial [Frankia sp.]|nr:4Fe-4S dicluster domain-containing protein [Frankia sp.]
AQTPTSPTLAALREVVGRGLAPIRTELGRFGRQVSGYALENLLPEHGFDVARALVGSEGTLATVLGATLRLVEDPPARVLVALGYPDMATAADAVPLVLEHRPVACEGLDSRIVAAVRQARARAGGSVPPLPAGSGWLLVELAGQSDAEVAAAAARLAGAADALDAMVVTEPAHADALWRIREDGAGLSSRTPDGRPAHSGWEDAAVPPERLGPYLRDFEELLAGHGLSGVPYGHFGDGCLHIRIDFPLDAPDGPARLRAFLTAAAHLVTSHGGSLSGEHGDGRARGELLPIMYSPAVIDLFRQVKAVFDPANLLNPGVCVDPRPLDADLRAAAPMALRGARRGPLRIGPGRPARDAPPTAGPRVPQPPPDQEDFVAAVHRCVGIGKCRADTTGTGGVMCPSFLATREEKDSTRGRARVLQELANGSLVRGWRDPAVHEVLDLCLSCKGCRADCPTGVDMATYKAEVLHASYRWRPRPRAHYSLGWLPRWARLTGRAPWLARAANAALAAPGLGRAARWAAGVDRRRALPHFAARTFRDWFTAEHAVAADGGRGEVLLWVDTFTNHFTPQTGIAAVRLLEGAGYRVRIPDRPLCCGLTWISTGQLDAARRILRASVAELARFADRGTPIVGLEPSCTAVFRSDSLELLGTGHQAATRVAAATSTLAELLARTDGWAPPDLAGRRVVAQPHCHHAAVLGWDADAALLARAGAAVRRLGGCCGLAGNFGMERGHYEVSVAVAEHALLPAVRSAPPGAVVLADGFSCRTQLADLAGTPARHLAELLTDPPPPGSPTAAAPAAGAWR